MSNSASSEVLYRERVIPRFTSFLPLLLIFPTFLLTLAPINVLVGIVVGLLITLVAVFAMIYTSPKIEIKTDETRVGKAKISNIFLGLTEIAPPGSRFAARIPNLDPRAFLALQSSVRGLVKVEIIDSEDPTPYWVFSTSQPEAVLAAITKAKASR